MSRRKHVPRNGIARALWEADPDTSVDEIPELVEQADRWECSQCSTQRFTRPPACRECGSDSFEKIEATEANDE
jgi:hypothetical protein